MARYGPQYGPDLTFLDAPRCTREEPGTDDGADVVILGAVRRRHLAPPGHPVRART